MSKDEGVKRIEQMYIIKAPINDVWRAFVDPVKIKEWSKSAVVMDDKEGTEFSLWDGDIHGTNTKIIPEKLLAQDWYGDKNWKEPSKLSLYFESNGKETVINLVQDNVPVGDAKDISNGWAKFYFGPLKKMVEK